MKAAEARRTSSFSAAGVEYMARFRCARCSASKLLEGRQRRRVGGIVDFVCSGCASDIDAKLAARRGS